VRFCCSNSLEGGCGSGQTAFKEVSLESQNFEYFSGRGKKTVNLDPKLFLNSYCELNKIRSPKLIIYVQQGKVVCLGRMPVSCSPFGQVFVLFGQIRFRADYSTIGAQISSPTLTYACLAAHCFPPSKICRHRSKLCRTKLDLVPCRSVGAAPSRQSAART
jgi:hypothetical protein